MNKIVLLSFIILTNYSLALFIDNNEIYFGNKKVKNYINKDNLSVLIDYDQNVFNKRDSLYGTCKTSRNCDFNQICYMNKCYENIEDQICVENPKDLKRHRGNCTDPYYCENGKCKKRISYNEECLKEIEYQCYETQDKKEPKCRKNKCQIKSEEEINFITSSRGMISVLIYGIFLVFVFFTVLHCVNRYNRKHNKIIIDQLKTNTMNNNNNNNTNTNIENGCPNELNPSFERNLYLRSIKEKEGKLNQDDDDSSKKSANTILNKYKTNDPYTTINNKKDLDTAGNTCPKTPQTASTTLINKSYSSTNNLLERNRSSQRSSILNASYRRNSSVGGGSPNENSIYNISFQDFNTSNSFSYLSPSDTKNMIPQFNTYNSATTPLTPITPITPNTLYQSQSLSFSNNNKRLSPIESPTLLLNNKHYDEAVASTSTPYIMNIEEEEDDNHTTLSFDDGVIKMSNKNFSMSFNSKDNNKDIVEISYSEDINLSSESIIPFTSVVDKKKDIVEMK